MDDKIRRPYQMKRHLAYLKYVLRHKWFVFIAGLSLRVPLWQLIIHDWHKFTPFEWFPYARCFYKPNGEGQYVGTDAFNYAWNRHQKRGLHHWQAWLMTEDDGGTKALRMPDRYVLEMIADWRGAGRALGNPDTLGWYAKNKHNMVLHPDTRQMVEKLLGRLV